MPATVDLRSPILGSTVADYIRTEVDIKSVINLVMTVGFSLDFKSLISPCVFYISLKIVNELLQVASTG
jgi:hypothetical protein